MTYFDNLKEAIEEGKLGRNTGLSTGFSRLDNFISLKKRMMISVIGSSGSGKSSFVNSAFILNPCEYAFENSKKIKIILFSMERSIIYTHAKWLVGKMFQTNGILIEMNKLLGWSSDRVTDVELNRIEKYRGWFESLPIDIYEGQRSPADIYRIVKTYAEQHGEERKLSEYKTIYVPHDEEQQVIVIVDHIGLTKVTKDFPSKKQAIDRLIEQLQHFRDHLGYTIIPVAQLNRDLSNPLYKKMDSFKPHMDNIKETGNLGEASDVVLSIWEPLRYNTTDEKYGDVSRFRSPINGNKYFRSLEIIKNTYGIDGASIGTAFMGNTGLFRELRKSTDIETMNPTELQNYLDSIFNHSFFL